MRLEVSFTVFKAHIFAEKKSRKREILAFFGFISIEDS